MSGVVVVVAKVVEQPTTGTEFFHFTSQNQLNQLNAAMLGDKELRLFPPLHIIFQVLVNYVGQV